MSAASSWTIRRWCGSCGTGMNHRAARKTGPYAARTSASIIREQQGVTEERFWAVVRGSVVGASTPPAQPPATPGWLVQRLLFAVGLAEEEIRAMTADEAQAAWDAYWAQPR